MKKNPLLIFLVSLFLLSSINSANAYFFATDIETQVSHLDENGLELIVTDIDDDNEKEVFPIGTKLKGEFYHYEFRRHFLQDENLRVNITKAELPDGTTQELDNYIKIKPRVMVSANHSVNLAAAAVATALKVTVAVWSVGFPVGRGAKAVADAAFAVYNTPKKESRWKQGVKGFGKGIIFPVYELVAKGEELPIHDQSYIWIQDAQEDKKKLSAFVVKRKNIFLTREKYYDDIGKEVPDYTAYLDAKDMEKYNSKIAKKAVKARLKGDDLEREMEDEFDTSLNLSEEKVKQAIKAYGSENDSDFSRKDQKHLHVWQKYKKPEVKFENN